MQQLQTFALVRALDDKRHSYLDALLPFVVTVLQEAGTRLTAEAVQSALAKRYSLNLPIHTVSSLLTYAGARRFIDKTDRYFSLNLSGNAEYDLFSRERDVEREIGFLISNLEEFLGTTVDEVPEREQLTSLFLEFIERNTKTITLYFHEQNGTVFGDISSGLLQAFVAFIENAEQSRPDLFEIITRIVRGSVICSMVKTRSPERLRVEFKGFQVFLDTNVIFSILGYHDPRICQPIRELYALIKREGFDLYVFDFTVTEIVAVLSGYRGAYYHYLPGVPVNSIYSQLRISGKTPNDMADVVAKIDDILEANGIRIFPTGLSLKDKSTADLDYEGLQKYKPNKGKLSLTHDLLAVSKIRQLRGTAPRKLEKAEYVFLSSDFALARYTLYELGHHLDLTISEVILDRLFTNILWFRRPDDSSIPVHSAIAAHANRLLIDNDVWNQFLQTIKRMAADGQLTERSLGDLIYSGSLAESLQRVTDDDVDVDEEFVGELLESAVIASTKEAEQHSQEVHDLQVQLEQASEQNDDRADQLAQVMQFISTSAGNSTRKAMFWIRAAVVLAYASGIGLITYFLVVHNINVWLYLAPALGLASFFGLHQWLNVPSLTNRLSTRLNRYYLKRWRTKVLGGD